MPSRRGTALWHTTAGLGESDNEGAGLIYGALPAIAAGPFVLWVCAARVPAQPSQTSCKRWVACAYDSAGKKYFSLWKAMPTFPTFPGIPPLEDIPVTALVVKSRKRQRVDHVAPAMPPRPPLPAPVGPQQARIVDNADGPAPGGGPAGAGPG